MLIIISIISIISMSNNNKEKFICNICNKELRTQAALIYHQNKKNSCKNVYSCKLCDKQFNVKFHLKAHMLECTKIDITSNLTENIDKLILKDDLDDIDYKKVLQYIPDMIVKYDHEGKFEYVSNASLELIGYSPEELIGKNGYEFILDEDIEYNTELHNSMLKKKKISATFIFRRICKDGSIKKIIAQANSIFDNSGNIIGGITCERAL